MDTHIQSSRSANQNTILAYLLTLIRMVRGDDPLALAPATQFIDAVPAGSVVVISAPPSKDRICIQ